MLHKKPDIPCGCLIFCFGAQSIRPPASQHSRQCSGWGKALSTAGGGNFVGGFLNRKGAVFRKLNRRRAPLERVLCLFRLTRSGRLPSALPTGETLPSLPSGELRPLRLRTGVRISYAISHPMDCRRSRNEVSSSAETSSATAPREQCDD